MEIYIPSTMIHLPEVAGLAYLLLIADKQVNIITNNIPMRREPVKLITPQVKEIKPMNYQDRGVIPSRYLDRRNQRYNRRSKNY